MHYRGLMRLHVALLKFHVVAKCIEKVLFLLICLISFFLMHGTSSSSYSNWWNLSLKSYSIIECFIYVSICKVVLCRGVFFLCLFGFF